MSDIDKLSEYIDKLNAEKKPLENEYNTDSEELRDLMKTVRQVRALKEPNIPNESYSKQLVNEVSAKLNKKKAKARKRWSITAFAASLAAVFLLVFNFFSTESNIVQAMEKAFHNIEGYHGILEVAATNGAGKSTLQSKLEVWANQDGQYYVKGLEGIFENIVTVNNGEEKWQVNHHTQEVTFLPPFPDPYRFIFEIGNEINDVKNALSYEIIGKEKVAGRETSVLEVTPTNGEKYKIWVDRETNLPLQKQSAMQNNIQYTATYTMIDFSNPFDEKLFVYEKPDGYTELQTNKELVVQNIQEANNQLDFEIVVPINGENFELQRIAVLPTEKIVKMYYKNGNDEIIFIQGKSASLEPSNTAILGKVNGQMAEIQMPMNGDTGILKNSNLAFGTSDVTSIQWQEENFSFAVLGNVSVNELSLFLTNQLNRQLEWPDTADGKPEVEVPVDLEVEKNTQISVDGGHSPWLLDPVYVAQVFVSLKISPEGIIGDYPIDYEQLKVIHNDGKEAIIEVIGDSPIEKVYLKRLVREDPTGIWTIVGYDPAK